MTKVKVCVSFIDAHTGENHPVGEVFEASKERIAEIQKVDADLILVLPEEENKPVKRTTRKKKEAE